MGKVVQGERVDDSRGAKVDSSMIPDKGQAFIDAAIGISHRELDEWNVRSQRIVHVYSYMYMFDYAVPVISI